MDELLDKDAKSELESELCINWSEEVKPPYKLKLFRQFSGSGMLMSDPDLFNPGPLTMDLTTKEEGGKNLFALVSYYFFVPINFTFESIDRIC
jgi:hypothetical protein